MEPFDSKTLEIVRRLKPREVLDFGSGESAKFANMLCRELGDLHVYCVDVKPVKETPRIFYLSHDLFLEEPSYGLERFKDHFDLAHSAFVFHEICHDYDLGEKLGGVNTPEASRILANLFHCLHQDATFILTDFVACDLYEFLKRTRYSHILESEEHKRLVGIIYDRCIVVDATPDAVEFVAESSQTEFGQDPGKIRDLMMRYYVRYERLPYSFIVATEDPFIHLLLLLRKYRDHHTRCTIDDYRQAVVCAGFEVVEEWTPDNMGYQLVCRKLMVRAKSKQELNGA